MIMVFFWLTSPMYGLLTACSVRIAHFLGADDWLAAKRISMLCYALVQR